MEPLWEFEPPKAKLGNFKPYADWAEPKLDGVRAIVHIHPERGVVVTTRRRNKDGNYSQFQDNIPHIRDAEVFKKLKGYTILDAELLLPFMTQLGDVMGVVGGSPAHAKVVQEAAGNAVLHFFDSPRIEGNTIDYWPLSRRRQFLEALDLSSVGSLTQVTRLPMHLMQEYVQTCWDTGFEGAVFKDPSTAYFHSSWFKFKKRETMDLQVTDWIPGKGKYLGTVGAVELAWPGQNIGICNCAPGTDATRYKLAKILAGLTRTQIAELALIAEVECQEMTDAGSLRHPRILRWRVDLGAY